MSLKEQLKEEIHNEGQKLKDMSLQDKLWYIWEYYKFHIGGVLIAILMIYVVASSIYNTTIHPGLYCVIVNNRSSQSLNLAPLEHEFHDFMEFNKKQPVYVESMFISYGDDATEYSYASMAKISALVASRDLDILIGDQETIDHYAFMDGLTDLSQLLPADILSVIESRLSYSTGSNGQSLSVSLDISGTDLAESMYLSKEASNLSVFSNSTHIDHSIALIRYIFGL